MNNTEKKEGSIDAIKAAIASLNQQGKKVTQQNVAELTKGTVSISTIRRHWKKISPIPEKISSMPVDSVTASKKVTVDRVINSFASFKRRAGSSTMGVYKCDPGMF